MDDTHLVAKAEELLARVKTEPEPAKLPASFRDALPPMPDEPRLDGKHCVFGIADNDAGHYMIYFEPLKDERYEPGAYYHAGYMFTDRDTIERERYGGKGEAAASCEYTKRPIHRDGVKHMLNFWRLEHLKVEWEYLPSQGAVRNLFWIGGDASWAEAQNVRDIRELEFRMAKAMKALGERLPCGKYSWLGLDYEVTTKNRLAIENARLKVEDMEARAAAPQGGRDGRQDAKH
jgi:hypothetical protein